MRGKSEISSYVRDHSEMRPVQQQLKLCEAEKLRPDYNNHIVPARKQIKYSCSTTSIQMQAILIFPNYARFLRQPFV